jgi:hypothetical protein
MAQPGGSQLWVCSLVEGKALLNGQPLPAIDTREREVMGGILQCPTGQSSPPALGMRRSR